MAEIKEKKGRIRNLKDTTANWERANPILLDGEMGIEDKGNGKYATKIGDGVTPWKSLPYHAKPMAEIEAEMAASNQTLQNQIDNIVLVASGDGDVAAEVAQARVDADGTNHGTLKERLDADREALENVIGRVENDISSDEDELMTLNSVVGLTWIEGGYIYAGGVFKTGDNTRKCTDYIVCNENTSITYVAETNHQNISGISFYDADYKFISGEVNVGEAGTEITTVSPVGTYYCRLSTKSSIDAKIKFEKSQLADAFKRLSHRIESVDVEKAIVEDKINSGIYTEIAPYYQKAYTKCTFNSDGTITLSAGGYYFPVYISPLQMKGDCIIRIKASGTGHFNISRSETSVSGGKTPYIATETNGEYEQVTITKDMWDEQYPYMVLRFDNRENTEEITIYEVIVGDKFLNFSSDGKGKTAYVSTDGSDENDGNSYTSAYGSIQKAINSGASLILVDSGVYDETVTIEKNDVHICLRTYPNFNASVPKLGKIQVNRMVIKNCSDVTIEDVEVIGNTVSAFYAKNVSNLAMAACTAHDGSKMGFELYNVNGRFSGCTAYNLDYQGNPDDHADGFNIHGYGYTEFINCSAWNCGDDGISHHDGCTGLILGGEFYGCGKGGVASPTGGAEITIDGVYCHDNVYGIYAVSTGSKATIRNCVLKNNTYDLVAGSGVTGCAWNNIYDTKRLADGFTEFN